MMGDDSTSTGRTQKKITAGRGMTERTYDDRARGIEGCDTDPARTLLDHV